MLVRVRTTPRLNWTIAHTFRLWVLSDVLSQVFLPTQRFLLRYHTAYDRDASFPELLAERLWRIVDILEVNLGNDLRPSLDNVWYLLTQVFQQALPRLPHRVFMSSDQAPLQACILRRKRRKVLPRERDKGIRDVACALRSFGRDGAELESSSGGRSEGTDRGEHHRVKDCDCCG